MPRCSGEGRIIQVSEITLSVPTPGGGEDNVVLTTPWVFKMLSIEWHPDDDNENLDISQTISVPSMILVAPRDDQASMATLYAPNGTSTANIAILRKMFGANEVKLYTNSLSLSEAGAWRAFYCFHGKNQTGAVRGEGTDNEIKGGWVLSIPNSLSGYLYPNSLAVIGASYGGLFGSNRKLYFQTGVNPSSALSQEVQGDLGLSSNEGNATITVTKSSTATDQDFSITVS